MLVLFLASFLRGVGVFSLDSTLYSSYSTILSTLLVTIYVEKLMFLREIIVLAGRLMALFDAEFLTEALLTRYRAVPKLDLL